MPLVQQLHARQPDPAPLGLSKASDLSHLASFRRLDLKRHLGIHLRISSTYSQLLLVLYFPNEISLLQCNGSHHPTLELRTGHGVEWVTAKAEVARNHYSKWLNRE